MRKTSEAQYKKVQGRIRLAYAASDPKPISLTGLVEDHLKAIKEAWGEDIIISDHSCYFKVFRS